MNTADKEYRTKLVTNLATILESKGENSFYHERDSEAILQLGVQETDDLLVYADEKMYVARLKGGDVFYLREGVGDASKGYLIPTVGQEDSQKSLYAYLYLSLKEQTTRVLEG